MIKSKTKPTTKKSPRASKPGKPRIAPKAARTAVRKAAPKSAPQATRKPGKEIAPRAGQRTGPKNARRAARESKPRSASAATPRASKKVRLLSGGNPQIAKAEGDAPVQAYIAALPGWKRDLARRIDALIVRTVPKVRKAVKWNSPFYGIEGQGWFMGIHAFTRYLKVAYFRGTSLRPVPPGLSKGKETRYLDIHEDDRFDEAQMAKWVKQAAALPGWIS